MAKKINITKKALIPGLIKPSRMSKGKLKPEDVVRATLSSFPDEVVDTISVEEEEKEEEELARMKESKARKEDVALKEMNVPIVREAQEQAIAKALEKRDQLCEISCALVVLASTFSVSRERE
ncbi:hypothetical protein Goshw_023501 [Gossypium schwendimanii]|uniref:Uncharacterized protein n=1 Tax=Gossypium schwendimanii TaxID=34291 RepID=A0A7J9KUW5_GOSSC|nr:hypothetical protein [Gossypium schwendimanii]